MSEINEQYQSLDEIIAIVKSFETCEMQPEQFTHGLHITVAVWYLTQAGYEEAEKNMRDGLHRFLLHYNLNGYNETITLFWLKVLHEFLTQSKCANLIVEVTNEAIENFSGSKLIFSYYSKEILQTEKSKIAWVEPDLKPFDFDLSFKLSDEHDGNAQQ